MASAQRNYNEVLFHRGIMSFVLSAQQHPSWVGWGPFSCKERSLANLAQSELCPPLFSQTVCITSLTLSYSPAAVFCSYPERGFVCLTISKIALDTYWVIYFSQGSLVVVEIHSHQFGQQGRFLCVVLDVTGWEIQEPWGSGETGLRHSGCSPGLLHFWAYLGVSLILLLRT